MVYTSRWKYITPRHCEERSDEAISHFHRNRYTTWIAVALLLVAVFLFMAPLAGPGTGLAAPTMALPAGGVKEVAVSGAASAEAAPAGITLADTALVTHTVLLPLVTHVEPVVPNLWHGAYFANDTLSGPPEYTTEEVRVDHDWGSASGPDGLPADHFSIRWTGDWNFEVGEYTFFVHSDDGVRLWLDEDPLIDAWAAGPGSHHATTVVETAGLHQLRLEYFEGTGSASVRIHWRRTDLYPQWHGDYYQEPWVEHGYRYARTDSAIQFDWGLGAPEGLPADSFSVAWNAEPLFEPGTHRIFLYADEGYQLLVDGSKVKEGGWFDGQEGGAVDTGYVLEVGSLQYHEITYNFHDRGTFAEARLWIVYMEHPTWLIEFYENVNLEGQPKFTDPDGYKIFFDWGLGGPWNQSRTDEFSIRWSGPRYFHAGCYRFGLFADDGVRLWVDGELLIDDWHIGPGEYHSPVTFLDAGYHQVVAEYFESSGEAEIRFWWE